MRTPGPKDYLKVGDHNATRATLGICCIKGCDVEARALGFCNHHYMQWMRHGHPLADELKYIRHGHRGAKSTTPEYLCWDGMVKRCTQEYHASWASYGGRGITVCDRWKNSFTAFLEDMGNRPEGTSLDRINNNGNYHPDNCRWATKQEQSENRRTTLLNPSIIQEAKSQKANGGTIVEIARKYGILPNTIYAALKGRSWRHLNA
jgi:hypothetical protein